MFSKNILQRILILIITLTNSINCETILDQALTTDNEVCKIVKQKLMVILNDRNSIFVQYVYLK